MGKRSLCEPYHDTILELNRQGLGDLQIAERLSISRQALRMYLRRRGIPCGAPRGWHCASIDRGEVRRLLEEEHLTHAQVAQILDCNLTTITRIAKSSRLRTARTGPRSGSDHPAWKGGRIVDKHGYVEVYVPLHPGARRRTARVAEHRLVMEVVLGRYLHPKEVVDHRDNHPRHNWPDNLRVYASNADHLRATLTGREKSTPRSSIPGAYGSNQKIDRCPEPHETLALCPPEIRAAVERHIQIHRPTPEQWDQPKSRLLRSGPHQPAFQPTSTG